MRYDFDEVIDRHHTNSMKYDGFKPLLLRMPLDEPLAFPDEAYIQMWVADMDFATPAEIRDAMKRRLDQKILGYTYLTDPEFYAVLAGWMQRRHGWTIDPRQVVLSPGVVSALIRLVGLATAPGEKVLLMTPSYGPFKDACDACGREVVLSPLINDHGYYTIDFDDLQRKAADPAVTCTIFCNPHNPSGRVWTEEELRRVGEICLANGVFIISDEIHCDLVRTDQTHIPFAKLFPDSDRIATCMAPSKTFNLAGNSFSNIIIQSSEVLGKWRRSYYDVTNPLSIAAAQAAYTLCDDWLEQLKAYLDDNFALMRDYLAEHLPEAVFRVPQGTYLGWVDVSAYQDDPSEDLVRYIADRAPVITESGAGFIAGGEHFIRINVACPRSTLRTALEGVCRALAQKRA